MHVCFQSNRRSYLQFSREKISLSKCFLSTKASSRNSFLQRGLGEQVDSSLGDDIFVHHSSISIKGTHYKYLVQGEYVSCLVFDCREEEPDSKHQFQAKDVKGILGFNLMCETHKENKRVVPRPSSRT